MRAVNIKWDTDGDTTVDLPTEIEIPEELAADTDTDDYREDISDYLSDLTGFCHFGFDLEE